MKHVALRSPAPRLPGWPWVGHERRSWRRRVAPGLLMLALYFPSAAFPFSLDQLLRLPLEQLMQLQISSRRVVGAAAECASAVPCTTAARRAS